LITAPINAERKSKNNGNQKANVSIVRKGYEIRFFLILTCKTNLTLFAYKLTL